MEYVFARQIAYWKGIAMAEDISGKASKKPLYKRLWFWVLAIIVIAAVVGGAGGGSKTTSSNASSSQTTSSAVSQQSTASSTESSTVSQEQSETTAELKAAEASVPTEYKSALKKAESYSNLMHMSKQGVYDQLTSEYGEQFSPEAAQYAIDNVKADWNANALEKAKSYQDTMNMSPSAIRDQLTSEYGEKFTEEEADYAIAHL